MSKTLKIFLIVILVMIVLGIIFFTSLAKEGVINVYNLFLKNVSTNGLTRNNDLEGKREYGIDEYVGTYKANYNNKSKEETIFGGTVLDRENGNTITLKIKVEKQSGNIEIISNAGTESEILINDTGETEKTVNVKELSYYLKVKVTDFTGNVEIIAE